MKLYQPGPVYGFDYTKVAERYNGAKFICEFSLSEADNKPVAWFKQDKPNRSLGHKKYFGLFTNPDPRSSDGYQMLICGREFRKNDPERFQDAVLCLKCDTYTFSRFRHDFHSCECGWVRIDGGKAYTKIMCMDNLYKIVKVDLITGSIVDDV
jgi:hypothetical protein